MKKHRILKVFLIAVLCIFGFVGIINIYPPTKVMDVNPFISLDDTPMLCAHRGGGVSNPENTLKAYKAAVNEYGVEILETDLWMTSDGHLVLGHDASINRTSDVEAVTGSTDPYNISSHTLEELSYFNYGALFTDAFGNKPYEVLEGMTDDNRREVIRNNDLSILEIKDLFEQFYTSNPDMLYIVEIKNDGELGYKAADILNTLLTETYPELLNRVVIGTFNNDVEAYLAKDCPRLLRGASTSVATKFIITTLARVNIFDNDNFACLQIPVEEKAMGITLNLTSKTYINRAHRRNIAVQYWTINDPDEMRRLIKKGCDAIMTDDPVLLASILEEFR